MVAGLRQLERLALSVDEFAVENKETAPVLVCIFWRPDLDQSQRWMPKNERLTRVAFTTELEATSHTILFSTRDCSFTAKAVRQLTGERSHLTDARDYLPRSERERFVGKQFPSGWNCFRIRGRSVGIHHGWEPDR